MAAGAGRRGYRPAGRRGDRRSPGQYQLQAAIAALHAQAPTFEATDWPQIAALYRRLGRLAPSPVVEVNRAVAVGLADGPQAGLAVLAPVLSAGVLDGYGPLHAAHADLLERAGDPGARAAWARAAAATGNAALRDELHRRSEGGPPRPAGLGGQRRVSAGSGTRRSQDRRR